MVAEMAAVERGSVMMEGAWASSSGQLVAATEAARLEAATSREEAAGYRVQAEAARLAAATSRQQFTSMAAQAAQVATELAHVRQSAAQAAAEAEAVASSTAAAAAAASAEAEAATRESSAQRAQLVEEVEAMRVRCDQMRAEASDAHAKSKRLEEALAAEQSARADRELEESERVGALLQERAASIFALSTELAARDEERDRVHQAELEASRQAAEEAVRVQEAIKEATHDSTMEAAREAAREVARESAVLTTRSVQQGTGLTSPPPPPPPPPSSLKAATYAAAVATASPTVESDGFLQGVLAEQDEWLSRCWPRSSIGERIPLPLSGGRWLGERSGGRADRDSSLLSSATAADVADSRGSSPAHLQLERDAPGADRRQQAAGGRPQAAGGRPQAAGSRREEAAQGAATPPMSPRMSFMPSQFWRGVHGRDSALQSRQQPISEVVLAAHHAAAVEDIHAFAAQDIHTFAAQHAAAAAEDIHTFAIHTAEDVNVSSVGSLPARSPALVTPLLLTVPTAMHSPTTAATAVGRATGGGARTTDHAEQSPVQASVDLTCLTNHRADASSSVLGVHGTPISTRSRPGLDQISTNLNGHAADGNPTPDPDSSSSPRATKGGCAAGDTPPSSASPSRHSSGFVSGYAPSLSLTSEPCAAARAQTATCSLLLACTPDALMEPYALCVLQVGSQRLLAALLLAAR